MNADRQRGSRALPRVLLAGALALAGVGLTGCRTTVYQRGDRAAESVRTAAREVQTQSQTLEATTATLDNLVNKPAADLKPQFQSFNSALDRLGAAVNQGGITGHRMARDHAAFVAAWNKQLTTITNADVRSRSEARRTEVTDQFKAAHDQYARAQRGLWSQVDYLRDIRKALSTDLTLRGLEAVKPLVSTAAANAGTAQTELTNARNELATLSTAMSSRSGPGGR